MSSNLEQEVLLEEIRDLLIEIRDTLQGKNRVPDEPVVIVDDSRGVCPSCSSPLVNTGQVEGGYNIYQCRDCETVWVNDEKAVSRQG